MPQKRNPDIAELARGRTARVYSNLNEILVLMKGLPLSYNRDLQQDKPGFFETEDILLATLDVFTAMLPSLRLHETVMRDAATGNFALATDYANYLTARGMPFREAHQVVGRLVQFCESAGKELSDLTIEELRGISPHFGEDALALDLDKALAARSSQGGTAPETVRAALKRARQRLTARNQGEAAWRR
jgi:argininosuccinate lyase